MGRIQTCQGSLGVRGVGKPERADFAVAPWLLSQPFHGVVPVGTVGCVLGKPALGCVAPTAVLDNHHITAGSEKIRLQVPDLGGFVVRRALEQYRKWSVQPAPVLSRKVNVRSQSNTVAHIDVHVALGFELMDGSDRRISRAQCKTSHLMQLNPEGI